MCTYVHVYACIHIHVCVNTYMYIYAYLYIYIYIYIYIYKYGYKQITTHTHTHIRNHVYSSLGNKRSMTPASMNTLPNFTSKIHLCSCEPHVAVSSFLCVRIMLRMTCAACAILYHHCHPTVLFRCMCRDDLNDSQPSNASLDEKAAAYGFTTHNDVAVVLSMYKVSACMNECMYAYHADVCVCRM